MPGDRCLPPTHLLPTPTPIPPHPRKALAKQPPQPAGDVWKKDAFRAVSAYKGLSAAAAAALPPEARALPELCLQHCLRCCDDAAAVHKACQLLASHALQLGSAGAHSAAADLCHVVHKAELFLCGILENHFRVAQICSRWESIG